MPRPITTWNDLPLYDPLDDDSVEAFRRRYLTTTYGIASGQIGATPAGHAVGRHRKFDERLYALRSGLQSWVTSPSTEIAERPDDPPPGRRSAVADQARPGRQPAHHRLDGAGHNVTIFPDPNARQLRPGRSGCWITTYAGTSATG